MADPEDSAVIHVHGASTAKPMGDGDGEQSN